MNSIKKKKFPCKDYIKQPYVSFLSKNKNKNKHFCTPPSNLTGIFFSPYNAYKIHVCLVEQRKQRKWHD